MSENRRALWNFQLLAHLAALLFAVAVFFRVDGIRHYTDPAVLLHGVVFLGKRRGGAAAVHPPSRKLRTREIVGGMQLRKGFEKEFGKVAVPLPGASGGAVIMEDTRPYPRLLSCEQRQERQRTQVAVHDIVFIFGEQTAQRTEVLQRVPESRQHEHSPAHSLDVLDRHKLRPLEKIEIKLHLLAVYGAVVVHHDLLRSAAVHFSEYLRDSYHALPP